MRDTDKDWAKIAETNPYWGVVSVDEFRGTTLDEARRAKFFAEGDEHIANLFGFIAKHLPGGFSPKRALDFGCGVGRLLVPIAKRVEQAIGVDVAPGMLELCGRHLDHFGLTNTKLVIGDDTLSRVTGTFDFVNSYIVLQHIPPARGTLILGRLLSLLSVGGTGCIQLTYAKSRAFFQHETGRALFYRRDGAVIHDLVSADGEPPEGTITMHDYDLNEVFARISQVCGSPLLLLPTRHDNHLGVSIIFRKSVEDAGST